MKLIKTFLLTALLTSGSIANAQCSFKNKLNPEQITAAQKIYHTAKYYDLGVTAIAVAYQESHLGRWKTRHATAYDRSYGYFHNLYYYATKGMTNIEKEQWIDRMINNDEYSIWQGIQALRYWKKHSKSYNQMLARFNGGWKGNQKYADKVKNLVVQVQKCKW